MNTHTETKDYPESEHDHDKCVRQALGTAEHLCVVRGVQLTPIRHQVLELIWESHKAVKAYELLDRIKPLQPAAKPATIYRRDVCRCDRPESGFPDRTGVDSSG